MENIKSPLLILLIDHKGMIVEEVTHFNNSCFSGNKVPPVKTIYDLIVKEDKEKINRIIHEVIELDACREAVVSLRESSDEQCRCAFFSTDGNLFVIMGHFDGQFYKEELQVVFKVIAEQEHTIKELTKELAEIKATYQDKHLSLYRDLTETNNELTNVHRKLAKRNAELEKAVNEIKLLSKMIPICSNCKNVRDDEGYWQSVADYLSERSEIVFTHSLCPDCRDKLYPGIAPKK